MTNTWNTWKLRFKASDSMDSELKNQMLVLPRLGGKPGQCCQQRRYPNITEEDGCNPKGIISYQPDSWKSFPGMVNHYGTFFRCLADLNSPLNNLLKKHVKWNWLEERQESFVKIKETLTSTEVYLPISTQMFYLLLQVMPMELELEPQVRRWEWKTQGVKDCFQNPLKLLPNREGSTRYYLLL